MDLVGDLRIKLGPVTVTTGNPLPPGAFGSTAHGVLVGTGSHRCASATVQPPGKKPMAAADWARGARLDETATRE